MATRSARLTLFAAVGLVLLLPDISSACCWRLFCKCHHARHSSGGYYNASMAPSAPVSAPPSQAPAMAYYPSYYYYPSAVPAPSQAAPQEFVTEIRGAIEVIKLLRDLRGEGTGLLGRGGSGGGQDESRGGSNQAELNQITLALQRIEANQEDLRGRLINNAGVAQSMGETLTIIHERVSTVEKAVGSTGTIVMELSEINKKLMAIEGKLE